MKSWNRTTCSPTWHALPCIDGSRPYYHWQRHYPAAGAARCAERTGAGGEPSAEPASHRGVISGVFLCLGTPGGIRFIKSHCITPARKSSPCRLSPRRGPSGRCTRWHGARINCGLREQPLMTGSSTAAMLLAAASILAARAAAGPRGSAPPPPPAAAHTFVITWANVST